MAVPGLDPGISPGHPRLATAARRKDVDARLEAEHDGGEARTWMPGSRPGMTGEAVRFPLPTRHSPLRIRHSPSGYSTGTVANRSAPRPTTALICAIRT